jgi:hypothetical protein
MNESVYVAGTEAFAAVALGPATAREDVSGATGD